MYSAVDDINRQVVETAVSGENIDLVRTGKQAIIGGVVGFGVGSAADSAITGVRKAFTKEAPKPRVEPKIVEGAEEAANINATPAMPEPVAKAAERTSRGSLVQYLDRYLILIRYSCKWTWMVVITELLYPKCNFA